MRSQAGSLTGDLVVKMHSMTEGKRPEITLVVLQ
jgi:hypothetical protein